MPRVLKIHPEDNVLVALSHIPAGSTIRHTSDDLLAMEDIDIKHKVATEDIPKGHHIRMYGTIVGEATQPIFRGMKITTGNTRHLTANISKKGAKIPWVKPDITEYAQRTFAGYHRQNGQVGTRNYWLFIPLVFCENRNIKLLQDTLVEPLGYEIRQKDRFQIQGLIEAAKRGVQDFDAIDLAGKESSAQERIFSNIDGIKFLTHEGGCGGTRQDSEMLCKLLATYITHPNVGGATVLSLGCQNAEAKTLQAFIQSLDPKNDKPILYFEQQSSISEPDFIEQIIKSTFTGLQRANLTERKAASLEHLKLGLECGGSDGFSGLSANPALGYCSDLLVALGASTILSEFPELHGAEQDIIDRCVDDATAQRFISLMQRYNQRAKSDGSGFEANPSPGNIRDGLITDAIKSLGAAKKGGSSPVVDVLDYGEVVSKPGLNLVCTPGNDVESTTGLAGAGANLIVFTTGLGTPTGNVIAPTVKMATNSDLARRMADIIDINAGSIIEGSDTIESKGRELLDLLIETASGTYITNAERLGQDDFIPWKRGISL
ncbi:MAG: altronate dehydratase [Saprospiraceae bacterium]|nr:altronate dehydratase [Saprospiraceae bacterium]